jgi:hypothetical protein
MSRLRQLTAGLALAFVVSCGGGSSAGGGGVNLPSGFPSDFPTYSGASVSAASSPQAGQVDVTWSASDKAGKLFAWYQTQLATGDWTVQGVAGDTTTGGLIAFHLKSSSNFGGTIKLADNRIHVIMGPGCPCAPPT